MSRTVSSAYRLPRRWECVVGDLMLSVAGLIPEYFAEIFLRRRHFYQTVRADIDPETTQGDSKKKWEAIAAACEVRGKSVLDIGCAEGFFCQEALRAGASSAMGVDSEFRSLLSARFLARECNRKPKFRMSVFPDRSLREKFDCVLCLSVLHHSVKGGMGTILHDPEKATELETLREQLKHLLGLVAHGGIAVIEVPYQYDEKWPRESVDFERFSEELVRAGFADACIIGTWESAKRNKARKDRLLYVANT